MSTYVGLSIMDQEGRTALRLIQALAKGRARLSDTAIRLRRRSEVKSAVVTFDCRRFELADHPVIALYLDAELDDGRAFGWLIDVECQQVAWNLEFSVRLNDRRGQEVLYQAPQEAASNLDEFIRKLEDATDALVTSVTSFDFGRPN